MCECVCVSSVCVRASAGEKDFLININGGHHMSFHDKHLYLCQDVPKEIIVHTYCNAKQMRVSSHWLVWAHIYMRPCIYIYTYVYIHI